PAPLREESGGASGGGRRFSAVLDDSVDPREEYRAPARESRESTYSRESAYRESAPARTGTAAYREPSFAEPPPREREPAPREPLPREIAPREIPREPPQREAPPRESSYRESPREPSREPPREFPRDAPPREPARERPAASGTGEGALVSDLSTIRNTLAHLEEQVSILPELLTRELQKLPDVPGLDSEGKRRYGWFLLHGVEEPVARKLAQVERGSKEKGLETALRRLLTFRDPLIGGRRDAEGRETSQVVALVGPTGVGKTTTLAKIAAELLLNRRRSVGMITLDTFRVGAVAQLETYARLLQVRLVVARTASEVKAGLHSLARCDYILVDTVGSSPYNKRQVNSTAEMLPILGEGCEVLLSMAGNVRETEQAAIFRRFSQLNPSGLIFTKLDETVTYGGVLNVALRSRLPLTFYTNGQRVPENLGWLSAEVIARWFEQPRKGENG
ncbi:MAG: hypothetical protein HQL51_03385, partial [Magnetococcales bacterium]|nr:hypothetical protein [Magnetococcales bacterium]